MVIRAKQPTAEVVIDLTGPQGNAFALLSQASRWARDLGLDANAILKEMREGDYEHLLEVFDREFGHFCVLEREDA